MSSSPTWSVEAIQRIDFSAIPRSPDTDDLVVKVSRHIGRALALQEEQLAVSLLGTGLTYAHVVPDHFEWDRSDDKITFTVTRNLKILTKEEQEDLERTFATDDPDATGDVTAKGDDHGIPPAA